MRKPCNAFTLAELLVSIAVLIFLVLFASRVVDSAATISTLGNKRMDADSQARPILDRMGVDLTQMIRRSDLDCYSKSNLEWQANNDRIAFFCNVRGYYPSSGPQSPISLVAYRINSDPGSPAFNRLQRMSKGLVWNGVSTINKPILFGLGAIPAYWPAAADNNTADIDYELFGPQVFRFEYFYLLKSGLISNSPGAAGLQDVAAISVAIAVIDQRSRLLLTNSQVTTLASRLKDFDPAQPMDDLMTSWRTVLDSIGDMPRVATNGVRLYQRYFYLTAAR